MAEYHVENFGCRASRADGEAIASGLRAAGLSPAGGLSDATVVVLNTCSVTAEADRSARSFLRKVRRENPEARVVFTGCYAQRAPREVAALDGVDTVVGNSHKARVVEAALALTASSPTERFGVGEVSGFVPLRHLLDSRASKSEPPVPIWHDPAFAHSEMAALPFAAGTRQTRPNLKIQDGCGNRCSFCIIPATRGPSRSVPLNESLRAVERFVELGGKELVLSGINLGRWGRDLSPAARFEDIVAAILEKTSLPRLRISSVEPMDWSSELIALFRQYSRDTGDGPRLARHAHLPLQSGSDAVLRAMHRRYRPWHYAAKVEEIRAALPEAAIGADTMVGFPGESDADFQETYALIERLPLTYLHIFPFSARPGTPGFSLHQAEPVPGEAVNERKAALRALISRKNEAFRRRFLGAELPVITLEQSDDLNLAAPLPESQSRADALSDNFIKISLTGHSRSNRIARVRVSGVGAEGLLAEPISAS